MARYRRGTGKQSKDVLSLPRAQSSTCGSKTTSLGLAEKPWSRLHLDYAGPIHGTMFPVLIDAHSKWMDVFPVRSATTSATLECLRKTFAIHGLAETIVTDNGSCFTSDEFATCMLKIGVV